MNNPKIIPFLLFPSLLICLFSSCKKDFNESNYTAYFGGEISNPTSPYILFCKESEVIDTIKIDNNNRFFIKFDSLSPGMYTFKNEPEYQYVYFDKNDSIMVQLNSNDFDESAVFCGRGDEKNNFLMELYLKNKKDKNTIYDVFDYNVQQFNSAINTTYSSNKKFYTTVKEHLKWSPDFDVFAKATLDLHYYSKKESYPVVHKIRTGEDITGKLPKSYYDFRKNIDFNSNKLATFSPYIMYITHMLNNVATIKYHNHFSNIDLELKTNINKLNIVDTLIKNNNVKNTVLNNIAFAYLLEDQNVINNTKFLEIYHKYSTDNSKKNEILKIGNAIKLLDIGNPLPEVKLMNLDNAIISSKSIANKKSVIFFWTENLTSHQIAVHKKILELKSKHPSYQFVAINLDNNQSKWKDNLSNYEFNGITELRCVDFEDLKSKWAITKVHRTIILNNEGKIKSAFTNIFDVKFEDNLK